ncbi:hypothetical protein CCHR01_02798 [Colletotrichum chrysophilum]|uniref:Uncharacterized protein n=1 Tax=Colletotrichum chrysophilum TaxID=1836956 RepID=A0AAD9EP49_9PEZI|nr:hypothetical protein CCHR01_02798 [Colletotrichum chrysophilum]
MRCQQLPRKSNDRSKGLRQQRGGHTSDTHIAHTTTCTHTHTQHTTSFLSPVPSAWPDDSDTRQGIISQRGMRIAKTASWGRISPWNASKVADAAATEGNGPLTALLIRIWFDSICIAMDWGHEHLRRIACIPIFFCVFSLLILHSTLFRLLSDDDSLTRLYRLRQRWQNTHAARTRVSAGGSSPTPLGVVPHANSPRLGTKKLTLALHVNAG